MRDIIRIGNAQAFWGDRPSAAFELLTQEPDLDYLTMDYLAEVSMSILATQRERDPHLGYPKDFVEVVRGIVPYWNSGGKCRLIANAGGLHPMGCATACQAALESAGCRSMRIGVVYGDDVLRILKSSDEHHEATLSFRNLDSGAAICSVASKLVTSNAYMGCEGIVKALRFGADIVITGRVADPSMVVGACVHAFGWASDAWDQVAGGTVAGHLLECGTHVTGGISTDWLDVPDVTHLGFPIAEIHRDGHCVITKSPSAGGRVTLETVKEQLIYEIGDPSQYISPDVTVSFLGIQLEQIDTHRVSVSGATGRPSPLTLKVSATFRDGYRAAGMLTVIGPDAVVKARRCGEIVMQRLQDAGHIYRDFIIECLGNADSLPAIARPLDERLPFEAVLRVAVEADRKEAVEAFTRELIPLVTAGPQGTTGYAEGRPRVHPVIRYWPCLIAANAVHQHVEIVQTTNTSNATGPLQFPSTMAPNVRCGPNVEREATWQTSNVNAINRSRLARYAYGRSGDKGTSANVGIIARLPQHYDWLQEWLTADKVKSFFDSMGVDSVERYELPNLGGLNFVVRGILKRSIRNDAQGKALAQLLLSIPVDAPP